MLHRENVIAKARRLGSAEKYPCAEWVSASLVYIRGDVNPPFINLKAVMTGLAFFPREHEPPHVQYVRWTITWALIVTATATTVVWLK